MTIEDRVREILDKRVDWGATLLIETTRDILVSDLATLINDLKKEWDTENDKKWFDWCDYTLSPWYTGEISDIANIDVDVSADDAEYDFKEVLTERKLAIKTEARLKKEKE